MTQHNNPDTDSTDDTRRAMNVDLSDPEPEADPDPAPQPEPEAGSDGPVTAATPDADSADGDGGEELDPKTVARRLLKQADDTDDAIQGAQQALQSQLKEYREVNQRIDERKGTISGLEETAKRVRDLPADALCLQTLSGGVSVEVKDSESEDEYSREDLIDDIHDAIEAHEEVIETDKERLEDLEAQCATIRQAAADLENLKELTDGAGQPGEGHVPDHERWPEH